MVKHRPNRPDSAPVDKLDVELGRLVSANAQVQADAQERLAAGLNWQVERFALRAIISQLPELVYAKDTVGRFLAADDVVARDVGLAHPIHEGLAAWTIWGEDAGCRGVFFTASGTD